MKGHEHGSCMIAHMGVGIYLYCRDVIIRDVPRHCI
jgi:hypothetical protein